MNRQPDATGLDSPELVASDAQSDGCPHWLFGDFVRKHRDEAQPGEVALKASAAKTPGMGSAGMTSQVGPAPDTNTTPAGGPGEAGTNLRTSEGQTTTHESLKEVKP